MDDVDVTIVDGSREAVSEEMSEIQASAGVLEPDASEKSSVDLDVTLKMCEEDSSLLALSKNTTSLRDALADAINEESLLTDDPDQSSLRLSEISAMVNGALEGSEATDEDENVLAHRRASQVELPNGTSVHAICVRHDQLSEVWITPEQIQTMAFEEGHPALRTDTDWTVPPQVGGLYAARYNDGFFYRCVVEGLSGQGQASVFFVDFGNEEIVLWRTDMVKLSKRFLSKPYMVSRRKFLQMGEVLC